MLTLIYPHQRKARATILAAHLKMLHKGMRNSRYTNKQLLSFATLYTGRPYKRGQYLQAITDLNNLPHDTND